MMTEKLGHKNKQQRRQNLKIKSHKTVYKCEHIQQLIDQGWAILSIT